MSKQLFDDSLLSGANASFIEAVYEDYLHNPNAVASAWREYFDQLAKQQDTAANKQPQGIIVSSTSVTTAATYSGLESQTTLSDVMAADSDDRKQVAVLQLINMHRYLGLNQAKLDPLGLKQQSDVPELDPAYFGFAEADMDKVFNTGSLVGPERATLR